MWLPHPFTKPFFALIVGWMMLLAFPSSGSAVGAAPSIVDLRLRPGEIVQRTITVINTDDEPRTFQFRKDNFTPSDEPGIPRFDGGAGDDLPTWISLSPDTLSIAPGETAETTLTVAVSGEARPGDYYGVVFVTPSLVEPTSAQTAVLVFLTVLGEANYDLDLVSTRLDRRFSDSAGAVLTLRVQNAGNVYLLPSGTVKVDPWIGPAETFSANPMSLRILSGESREWEVNWASSDPKTWRETFLREWRAFALGPVVVTVSLEEEGITESARTWFVAFPWRTVLLVLILVLVSKLFAAVLRKRATS